MAHLRRLGIAGLAVPPDPVRIATDGAAFGSIKASVPDHEGRRQRRRRWMNAERLVHKLDTFTEHARLAQQALRDLIWALYDDLLQAPTGCRREIPIDGALRRRLRTSQRLAPSSTNCSSAFTPTRPNSFSSSIVPRSRSIPSDRKTTSALSDHQAKVQRRTRGDADRDCSDAFLGFAKTCAKLGISVVTGIPFGQGP
jgi:hypothetical protein